MKCTYKNPNKSAACEMCQGARKSKERSSSSSMLPSSVIHKKGVKQKYHEIVRFCVENGIHFVDDSFPPSASSQYYNPKSVNGCELVCQWLRPSEIVTEHNSETIDWVVFRTPLPSDISQGNYICFDVRIKINSLGIYQIQVPY